ncbi:hypothetical protein ABZ883_03000 [Streptomyces sp. NPDC046977]|uniref:hypothetical protein n=1 Tax=Streptomyces sp. NPDC046977 TaxID=3154703 RepID=UPI0033D5BD94
MTAGKSGMPQSCARCGKTDTETVPFMVETGSGPGGMGVVCADAAACVSRAPAPRWTAPR